MLSKPCLFCCAQAINPTFVFRCTHSTAISNPQKQLYEVYGWNSIARLTKEPLDEMTSVQNAPKIYATMIQQGADLANTPGYEDGNYYIPQVRLKV